MKSLSPPTMMTVPMWAKPLCKADAQTLVAAVLFVLRERAAYPRRVIGAGSFAAIAIDAAWLVERTAKVSMLPI